MSIGSLLLGGLASAATKAYQTAAEKKKEQTTSKTNTSTATKTITPSTNEHQNYINQNYSGGLDAYTKLQNDRYNKALAENNVDLLNKLTADANKVGYSLSSNQVAQPMVNPYDAFMEQQNKFYADQQSQIQAMNQAAVKQGVANLNSQKTTVNQNYDDIARQAYITSMQNKKALPQQLAASGVNGGASETAMLGLSANYENNLNKINTGRSSALNDIDTAIANLKNEGELSTAEQVLQNNQAALTAYQNMLNNSANYNQWLANYNLEKENTEYDRNIYEKETATAQKQQEYNNILARLGMGLISENDAVALGVPAADVQAYVNRIIAAQNADLANTVSLTNNRNSSGTSSKAESQPTDESSMITEVVKTANSYLKKGDREKAIQVLSAYISPEQIKKHFESMGVRTDDIDWGDTTPTSNLYENPLTSLGSIISFYKNKGYSSEQIAERLNRNS